MAKHVLTALALSMTLAGPVMANPCIDQRPPAQYNYEPTIPYTVERVTRPKLIAACRFYYESGTLWACARLDTSTIYIMNHLPNSGWLNCLLSHEKAHLNGWPADHPRWIKRK